MTPPSVTSSPPTAQQLQPRAPVSAARASTADRLIAAVLALAALAVLVTASMLTPADRGIGTHMQLGLPPCGWMLALGRPCPTCGMTTAFAAAAAGDPLGALRAQPFGALLALATASFFWGSLHVAATGSRLGTVFVRSLSTPVMGVIALLFAAAWAYKLLS